MRPTAAGRGRVGRELRKERKVGEPAQMRFRVRDSSGVEITRAVDAIARPGM